MKDDALEKFEGFSPKALAFLRDLAKNNRREWFQPRKDLYERELLDPLRSLVVDAVAAMRKAKIPLTADIRRSPFRIYRDIRFSRDKSPYKTNLGAYLSPGGVHDESGGLYVHIQPKNSFMALAFYQLEKPALERWRRAIAEHPARFQAMQRALSKNKLKISDEHIALKRMPRGYDSLADSPLERYLRMDSFVVSEDLTDRDVGSRRLIDKMVSLAKRGKPLVDYGRSVI